MQLLFPVTVIPSRLRYNFLIKPQISCISNIMPFDFLRKIGKMNHFKIKVTLDLLACDFICNC